MTEATRERPGLLANFELPAGGPQWLRRLRGEALARFEALGFPTSRLEEWKNTNVAPIASTPFVPAPAADGAELLGRSGLDGLPGPRRVLVNGRAAGATTGGLPAGLRITGLADDPPQEHFARLAGFEDRAFTALNTAFAADGTLVAIDDGVQCDEPIVLFQLSVPGEQPAAWHPRTLVVAGAESRATVIEVFAGEGPYFTNAVTEVHVGDNAAVEHYRVQLESPEAFHVGALHTRQGRNSRFTGHNYDLGAALSRLDGVAVLDGEGAECLLHGLYLTTDRRHVDNHTTLDHAKPHCQSREVYKGILTDRSRAVFNGRIIVRQDAQKTDAKQSNPNLLLSDGALVHTRPQLEIYADDVKCTHGATIGRLDEDARFYLRSRGVGAVEAGRMLIRGFAVEVLDHVQLEPLRRELERRVFEGLK